MIVMTLMLSGCGSGYLLGINDPAHGIYSISQSELNSEIEHFEQTKGISCSDIPEIYDISRLRVGSMVDANIKVIRGNSENHEMSYTTIMLNDIETTEEGEIYQEKILATTYPGEILSNYKPDELKKVICKKVEGQTSKIIDFKLAYQEELKVADKPIACKVYKFNKITAGTTSGYYSLTNNFTTLWVSDEIPFGIVKDETKTLVVSETFPTSIGSKTFTNRIKAEMLINFEVTGFDYATVVNPVAIIQDIKKNGLGDRYFIKDIPISSEKLAGCFMIAGSPKIGCATSSGWNITFAFPHSHSLWHIEVAEANYVTLASPEIFKKIMTHSHSILAEAVNLIFLYPKEISISKDETSIPITIPLSDGSIHIRWQRWGSGLVSCKKMINARNKT